MQPPWPGGVGKQSKPSLPGTAPTAVGAPPPANQDPRLPIIRRPSPLAAGPSITSAYSRLAANVKRSTTTFHLYSCLKIGRDVITARATELRALCPAGRRACGERSVTPRRSRSFRRPNKQRQRADCEANQGWRTAYDKLHTARRCRQSNEAVPDRTGLAWGSSAAARRRWWICGKSFAAEEAKRVETEEEREAHGAVLICRRNTAPGGGVSGAARGRD